MSSPDGPKTRALHSRRRILAAIGTLAALSPLVAACGSSGFQPLYGPTASGERMTTALANVDIAPIPGRVGQRVRNELIFQMTGGAGLSPSSAKYRLDIAVREYLQSTLVSSTGVANSQVYSIDANFKLVRLSDNQIVFKGNSYGRAPFDTNTVEDPLRGGVQADGRSVFANIRAQSDAQNRAATTLAGEIRTRLAAYLTST